MTDDISHVEVYTLDECDPCKKAIEKIRPVLREKHIPLVLKRPTAQMAFDGINIPLICIVRKKNGINRECIQGYSNNLDEELRDFL